MNDANKTIGQLEIASQNAVDAFDAAEAQRDKVRALIAALVLAEDHVSDAELPLAARRAIGSIDFTAITNLKEVEVDLSREVDRLETIAHEAARALNDAPEEAA